MMTPTFGSTMLINLEDLLSIHKKTTWIMQDRIISVYTQAHEKNQSCCLHDSLHYNHCKSQSIIIPEHRCGNLHTNIIDISSNSCNHVCRICSRNVMIDMSLSTMIKVSSVWKKHNIRIGATIFIYSATIKEFLFTKGTFQVKLISSGHSFDCDLQEEYREFLENCWLLAQLSSDLLDEIILYIRLMFIGM